MSKAYDGRHSVPGGNRVPWLFNSRVLLCSDQYIQFVAILNVGLSVAVMTTRREGYKQDSGNEWNTSKEIRLQQSDNNVNIWTLQQLSVSRRAIVALFTRTLRFIAQGTRCYEYYIVL